MAKRRKAKSKKTTPRLSKSTWHQFRGLVKPYFVSDSRRYALGMLGGLLALSGLISAVQVVVSYANRDVMTDLSHRDGKGFYVAFAIWIGTLCLAVPIGVMYRYFEERLALAWREWMTYHLIDRYLAGRAYYTLKGRSDIDNPDQRISEDVRNFTATTLSFILLVLNSTITLCAFIGVLFSISGLLVAVLIAYSVIGTLMTAWVGRKLVRLQFRQSQREAGLRYSLIRVRENAESIAFFRGEPRERFHLRANVESVLKNNMFIILWNRRLAAFTSGYNYVGLALPVIIVAPLYLKGEVEFGVITQAAGAFAQVLAALSIIVTQFERLSAFGSSISRLYSLWYSLDDEVIRSAAEAGEIGIIEKRKPLSLANLTVRTPDGSKELIKNLSLELTADSSLLIMGPSGTGKSSLLRTIAGLWNAGEGTIHRPRLQELLFLPQRPYMLVGTLREQLAYPSRRSGIKDRDLRAILQQVHLEELVRRVDGRLDQRMDWGSVLSLGEQQRLSFARLLLRRPLLTFLDESTSALDEETEKMLYELLVSEGLSFISVGHRSTLKPHHRQLLIIEHGGSWQLQSP